ncbi:MAG: PEP-CTERM sorting domain-containing protein [Phycisphaerae bacterium]
MRINLLSVLVVATLGTCLVQADLVNAFSGFDATWEIGVSGLKSSYYNDTAQGHPLSGPTISNYFPELGPDRVSYPSGVGQVPSPGGSTGLAFDQGVLGAQVVDGALVLQLATALDPHAGYYHNGWGAWYGEGDLFVTVSDSDGISHFALLNTWARNSEGDPISLNGGHFADAQEFHLFGGTGDTSLEGHLVALLGDGDVTLTGGQGAYTASNAPVGLDMRAFAEGGDDLGDAGLTYATIIDSNRTWYLETWSIDLSQLSTDATFDIALHTAASCGNDQIALSCSVPEPGTMLLVVSGLALAFSRRRGC